jgi:molybdate transport system substrate-binding protein
VRVGNFLFDLVSKDAGKELERARHLEERARTYPARSIYDRTASDLFRVIGFADRFGINDGGITGLFWGASGILCIIEKDKRGRSTSSNSLHGVRRIQYGCEETYSICLLRREKHLFQKFLSIFLIAWLAVSFQHGAFAQQVKEREVTVFAAASLNEAFSAMGHEFEHTNPDTKITFNFAGSQQLVQQIAEEAPVDVFASANMKQMNEAVKSGRIDSASIKIFAYNRLVVVCPKENSAGIRSLHDLSNPHLKIVLADKAVPVGQYGLEFLEKCNRSAAFDSSFEQSVLSNVVSYEENVKAVLSKVSLGEADAGIVYTSDISKSAGEHVRTLEIPQALNVIATYPIAVARYTPLHEQAEKFVRYILSDEGQNILGRFGFIPVK